MSFSSGTFSLVAGNPVVTGTTISSTTHNSTESDIASGLTTCVLKDGTQTLTANIPMSGFKFTGLAAGSAAGDSVRWEQQGVIVQNSQTTGYTCVLTDAGKHIYMTTAGTYTIPANASVAYIIGTAITFVNGTTSSTIPITTDTMTLAGTATTGTRTLAANGIATAIKVTATAWIISGSGLS
mgnify:CR=1 FL=1